jgi:hypothetical protein
MTGFIREIDRLKEEIARKVSVEFRDNAYWGQEEGRHKGPFCSVCKETKEQLVTLKYGPYMSGTHLCTVCNRSVDINGFKGFGEVTRDLGY